MFEKISTAFNPVIELLQAVSFPLAFLCITLGILLLLVGQRHKAMQIIKYAVIGYLAMQLVPGLMQILHSVGQQVGK